MSFRAENLEKIEGSWELVVAQQSPGVLDAAKWFAEIGFVIAPSITEVDGFEQAIKTVHHAGRLLLLSDIDHPYVGDLTTHAQWETLNTYVFTRPVDLGHKIAHPLWYPFNRRA